MISLIWLKKNKDQILGDRKEFVVLTPYESLDQYKLEGIHLREDHGFPK
jgi:hypothetical protein